ncbi:MAG TPA: type IV toxin-antitoxin system AbiEi family antitoxin domain-containing protein [Acidimicrobiia bacterium]|nr:type IV toxin-antitoxin system AbiEi family antitoxin domain-containing protein [Acidimicrobiia bacterium]
MDRDALLRISAEAARHHGVFTREFALAAGASSSGISRRVQSGTWTRPLPGVYLVAGSPATWHRAVAVAVYGSGEGAVASHATAAHLWDLAGRPRVIEATTPNPWRPPRDHIIHRSTDLIPGEVIEVDGIPCTDVARCLVDIGVPWGERMASRALDEAVRRELTTERKVAAVLHRVARCGRNGVGPMRIVLEDRLGWSSLTESQIEGEFVRIMQAAGIDLPQPQVNIIKRGGRFIARVDFVYPDFRLVIALDGERYHSDRNAFRHDRRQQNDLTLEGYRILRFTAWDVFAAPEYVVASVVSALLAHNLVTHARP